MGLCLGNRLFQAAGSDPDLLGIRDTQRQLIAVDLQLHGVTQRGQFDHGHLRAGDHTHIEEVLP